MSIQVFEINNLEFETLARNILSSGKSIRFRARGCSMRPFIREGDILLARPIDSASVRVGEIILFGDGNGGMLAHRVIKKYQRADQTSYITSGDSNRSPDREITKDRIMGRIVALERQGDLKRLDNPASQVVSRLWVGLARIIKPLYFSISGTTFYKEWRTRI
jgi:hypothetical protein